MVPLSKPCLAVPQDTSFNGPSPLVTTELGYLLMGIMGLTVGMPGVS